MKVRDVIINNKKVMQIYISKDEADDFEVEDKIKEYKQQNNVVVFQAGEKDTEISLQHMLQTLKESLVANY